MATKFEIEKVKWTWAKEVKSKDVYRDDEFVRTKTYEGALGAIDFLLKESQGMTYTITVKRDEGFFTYWRHTMPCLGGLVKYRDSHGKKYFMNPYFPRDIRVAYPDGDTVLIGCCRHNMKQSLKLPYYQFVLSDESPWISAFGHKDSFIFKDNYFVLTNMNTDPTVFYSMMRLGRFIYHSPSQYGNAKWHPKADILAMTMTQADPRRIAGQKPLRISGGTWAEGFGYTRPYNESIFKTKLPTKLSDFGKLSGYPQAPHTNKYFTDEIKKNFKVDFAKAAITVDKANEEVLLKAWDYFKEKAVELSDSTEDVKDTDKKAFSPYTSAA